MKQFKDIFLETLTETNTDGKFGVVLLGGSIGEKAIRSPQHAKGVKLRDADVFGSEAEAKAKAKRMNDLLSPGEKKYYGLKYVVVKTDADGTVI